MVDDLKYCHAKVLSNALDWSKLISAALSSTPLRIVRFTCRLLRIIHPLHSKSMLRLQQIRSDCKCSVRILAKIVSFSSEITPPGDLVGDRTLPEPVVEQHCQNRNKHVREPNVKFVHQTKFRRLSTADPFQCQVDFASWSHPRSQPLYPKNVF